MRMRTSLPALAAAAALAGVGATAGTATAAPSAAAPAAGPRTAALDGPLTVQPVPPGSGRLFDVAPIDAHTVFAGGMRQTLVDGKALTTTPLLLAKDDRDGRGWREVPLPPLPDGDTSNEINAVTAVPGSAGEAWAVGLESTTSRCAMPGYPACGPALADHWDGTSWQSLPVPMPANAEFGGLTRVAAAAPGDVWAVGWAQILDSATPNPDKPGGFIIEDHFEALVEHWDGHAWTRVAVPDEQAYLPGALALGGTGDVWTAGYDGRTDVPVVQHWDGHAWTVEKLPRTGLAGEIYALGVDAAGTPWAVGRTVLTQDDPGHALVLREVDGKWRRVAVPAAAGQLNDLAFTPGGITVTGNAVSTRDGYAMRLDADGWHRPALPATGGLTALDGVAYSPGQGLTLVGDVEPDGDPFSDSTTPLVLSGS